MSQKSTPNVLMTTSVKPVGLTVEMMIMINQIIKFHADLKKGESVKLIMARDDYSTFIGRTDLIKKVNEDTLCVFRANGAKVALNSNYIVACCVIERF